MMFGERLRYDDVVEHLHEPDAPLVTLLGNVAKHRDVLLEYLRRNLKCVGIVVELYQRSKWMTVPDIERVHPVFDEKVEILSPILFVVEKGEQLGRVWILIDFPARQDRRLLHAKAGTAELEGWSILEVKFRRQ